MINGGIHPDVVTFNSLINALCKEKRTEEAITMLELQSQRGVKLYGVTYNIMIRLYCGQDRLVVVHDTTFAPVLENFPFWLLFTSSVDEENGQTPLPFIGKLVKE
ncbi:hypothetical protein J1N35_037727 [Gossypium stocksii]|uniref:Uncharacterized protein n=1 Tax=Gossypium stocksii TaxID=47602 RepID=A0A9D3UKU4_9ROSI|nr:hypothetical protein J1N35_037727 [Gossypium stocksii]